jgi:hypothetical protein
MPPRISGAKGKSSSEANRATVSNFTYEQVPIIIIRLTLPALAKINRNSLKPFLIVCCRYLRTLGWCRQCIALVLFVLASSQKILNLQIDQVESRIKG